MEDKEKRLEKLEYQMKQVALLLDGDTFKHIALQLDLSEQQVNDVYELMRTITSEIEAGNSVNHFQFEKRIKQIVSSLEGNEPYIILDSLQCKFPQAYAQLKPPATADYGV